MISRITRGSRAMESITDFIILNLLPLVMQLIIIGASIWYFDFTSAMVIFVTALMFIIYSLFIVSLQNKTRVKANDAEDREKANIGDTLLNIDSIKYFGKENRIKKVFSNFAANTRDIFLINWNYYRWLESGQAIILGIGVFFLIYFPIKSFLAGQLTIGTLAFIYTVYLNISAPLFGFVWGFRRFYEGMADFQALFEYGKMQNEIKDIENAKEAKIRNGEIVFEDIRFTYPKRKNGAINGFSLKIKPNEKIALVGHSGCGKTTLIKLLYRLYDVDSGKILIDGKDIKSFKQQSLRAELSIVPQETILFDDTIYNNVAFSNPSASKSEVLKAMKFAQLDKLVSKLPLKEDTIVGERGVKLSGGEKQRVSIARAILANKKILVLDEATSSLDSQTEHEIQNDLENLMKDRTSIIIAHRLSTIMSADRIVVMEKGKIVQIGKHRELINKRGVYSQLWKLQKGGYIGE